MNTPRRLSFLCAAALLAAPVVRAQNSGVAHRITLTANGNDVTIVTNGAVGGMFAVSAIPAAAPRALARPPTWTTS